MLAVKPTLSPEALREKIKASARAYPAESSCGHTKESAICGVGMLDAAAAVAAARTAAKPQGETAD
jgi:hypothetical protein